VADRSESTPARNATGVKWSIIAVGRVKEPFYRQAIAEYLGRLGHSRQVTEIEVAEEKLLAGRETMASHREAAKLLAACKDATRIALTERGDRVTTVQLASRLERLEAQGNSHLAFVLGGPQGLDPDFVQGCSWELSLSPLTFPYQLARLVLVEQLYRCETLRRNEPYHKA